MGRFKIKKQDTFIDMTPMSDVMVLLLTFFMLTATFVKEEPVKVVTPGSVSEIKIPESNLLTIFVRPNADNVTGKVFMTMDSKEVLGQMADKVLEGLTPDQKKAFQLAPTFGYPKDQMKAWLDAPAESRNSLLNKEAAGIPCDSANDQLKEWVQAARDAAGDNMRIAIKADQKTPYAVIKNVMNSLRSIHENRYNLITSLKNGED